MSIENLLELVNCSQRRRRLCRLGSGSRTLSQNCWRRVAMDGWGQSCSCSIPQFLPWELAAPKHISGASHTILELRQIEAFIQPDLVKASHSFARQCGILRQRSIRGRLSLFPQTQPVTRIVDRFDPNDPPLPLHRTERGGEVTYHGPGQVVVYPILNLQRLQPDLHLYLRGLEEVVCRCAIVPTN